MSSSLAVLEPTALAVPSSRSMLSRDDIELLKTTICAGATDSELALFVQDAQRRGLDPFARQICAVFRWDGRQRREVMSIQVTIDGFRLIAERTGHYGGQIGPYWCGPDGQWLEVWLDNDPPAAAKVGVIRRDWQQPLWSVATWKAYAQRTKEGQVTRMWAQMPDMMLAKAAESLALRRAFPAELSGAYSPEEMGQSSPVVVLPDGYVHSDPVEYVSEEAYVESPITFASTRGHRASNNNQPTAPAQAATPKQIKFIQGIARELGFNDEQLNAQAEHLAGVSVGELSRRDASALVEWLQARRGMADLSGPGPSEPESPPARTPSVSQSPSPRKSESAPTPSQNATEPPKPTTPMQRLHGAAKRRGLEHEDVHALAVLWFQVASTKDLTPQQFTDFAAWLSGDIEVDDEQLASELAKARGAVTPPAPGSPDDLAAIEHITSTPSTAPAPDAERRQQIEDDKDNWTAFWREARQMGFKTKDAIEQYLGHSITSMTPAQVRAELDSRLAEAK